MKPTGLNAHGEQLLGRMGHAHIHLDYQWILSISDYEIEIFVITETIRTLVSMVLEPNQWLLLME
jgi:hypothetical protein